MEIERRDQSCQWQRYELKFVVDPATAIQVSSFSSGFLPPDRFNRKGGYPIQSLYLDSHNGACYRSTMERRTERFKLRVRTYKHFRDATYQGPVFLEIKRKLRGVIAKTRARLDHANSEELVWGQVPLVGRLLDSEGNEVSHSTLKNVNEFLAAKAAIHAKPTVGVYYEREAYESSASDGVRVTVDRNIHYGLCRRGHPGLWWPVPMKGVIIEVKFTSTYPDWLAHMIRRYDLTRRGVCKYAMCYEAKSGNHLVTVN